MPRRQSDGNSGAAVGYINNFFMLGLITIGLLTVFIIAVALLNRNLLLYIYAASLPFFGVVAEVGVQITPYLVVSLGMIIAMALSPTTLRLPKFILPYLFYSIFITMIMAFFLPDDVRNFPLFRGQLRWVSQIVMIILLITPVLYFNSSRFSEATLFKIINIFIYTVGILCLTGIIQLIVFKQTGKDIFPINMFTGETEKQGLRSALTRISRNEKVLRMSAFGGGEPKNFGYTCVIALSLHFLSSVFNPNWRKRGWIFILFLTVLFTGCILLTLSTQAYLLIGLDLIVFFGLMMVYKKFISKQVLLVFIFSLGGIFFLVKNDYARRLVELRLYERLTETGAVEDFNETVIDFLKAQPQFIPFGTGLGNVHFWAQEYIPTAFKYYMRNSVFVAKAGLLRVLSELGVVGVILFFGMIIYLFHRLSNTHLKIPLNLKRVMRSFLIIVILNFIVSTDSSPYYIFSIALALGCIRVGRKGE